MKRDRRLIPSIPNVQTVRLMLAGHGRKLLAGFLPLLLLVCVLLTNATLADGRFNPTALNAGADDPLFTTYAADLPRARFVPDQGYHFRYYRDELPVAFTSAQDGEWGVVFDRNGDRVLNLADWAEAPVVQESWPDYVRYTAKPYADLALDGRFFVYNSSLAVWELTLTNESASEQTITVAPYLGNELLLLPESDASGWSFRHEHPADGWTVAKKIPHAFERRNRFTMLPVPDTSAVFSSVDGASSELPEWVKPDEAQVLPVYGRLQREDGSRIEPSESRVQAYAFLTHDPRFLVSLASPVHASSWDWWKQRGYFALETGGLEWSSRVYSAETGWRDLDSNTVRIVASVPSEKLSARWEMTRAVPLNPDAERHDLTLTRGKITAARNLRATIDSFGVHLEWDGDPKQIYRIYMNPLKCRLKAQEKSMRDNYRDEFLLAGARDIPYFRYHNQVQGTSYNYDLSPRVPVEEREAGVSYGFNPDEDIFLRRFMVVSTSEDKYPGPASETVSCWPMPTLTDMLADSAEFREPDALMSNGAAMFKSVTLAPGESKRIRVFRQTAADLFEFERNQWLIDDLAHRELGDFANAHRERFASVPEVTLPSRQQQLLQLSSYNLLRQSMLPPEGRLTHNYYVFSREPMWGWGHGGQVFHESLAMLAYGHLDPRSALASMKVFAEAQHAPETDSMTEWAYIPYRVGPYLEETIETNGDMTQSGPFYSWITHELYQMTGDRDFLAKMAPSCERFVRYWKRNRDTDSDGLYEWGGQAVLESLRDASVVIWDDVAPPDSLEALGLNCMLANEFNSLAAMQDSLGNGDAATWLGKRGAELAYSVQRAMWDEETGFFYHNVKRGWAGEDGNPNGYTGPFDNAGNLNPDRFSFNEPGDLKRKEIIGFLPLWAGIATEEQAERLVREHLTNPDEFWREYGVPSLSADDPYYKPQGYWNGPVWVQWNYLIVRGLLRYGYVDEARELAERVSAGMSEVLAETHTMWEFYSPDEAWGGWHQTYIWAGIVTRMMEDVYGGTE
ncbi:hypothetical protein KQI52_03190 [bacterium]|nr:hypothetical protein [bacterium]